MSQMERRGFFSLLVAGVAGLLLPDTLIFEPGTPKPIVLPDLSPVNLQSLTEAVSAEFERQMGGIRLTERPQGFSRGEVFDKHFHCSFGLPFGETSDIHERYINPVATAMAEKCKVSHVHKFGNLPSPFSIESVRAGCIRGFVVPYCIVCDNTPGDYQCRTCGRMDGSEVFRFDVLGAAA